MSGALYLDSQFANLGLPSVIMVSADNNLNRAAIAEGLADANPVVGTNKAAEEIPRDRVLSDKELCLVWTCAGGGDYGAIVRLLPTRGCDPPTGALRR